MLPEHRGRLDVELPEMRVKNLTRGFQINIDEAWLKGNALSEAALQDEVREWATLDMTLRVKPLRKEQAAA